MAALENLNFSKFYGIEKGREFTLKMLQAPLFQENNFYYAYTMTVIILFGG
jgi:hypothetical protein